MVPGHAATSIHPLHRARAGRPARRARPVPIDTGEELLLVARSDGSGPLVEAVQTFTRCRIRTLDEWPGGHWSRSWHQAGQAMAGVLEAIARGPSRPKREGDRSAARFLRQLLRKASTGRSLDAASLASCLRRLPADDRRLLLEALSGEVVDAARAGSVAPLQYAREPLLTENELAREVRRTIPTVRRWRVEGTGPVFVRIERAVRYSRVDLDNWFGQRLVS